MKKKSLKKTALAISQGLFVIGFAVLAGFFAIRATVHVSASGSDSLHGFLWSDMPDQSDQQKTCSNNNCGKGFGWISLNSSDTNATPNPLGGNYSVGIDPATGYFSGYAWTPYGGWVDFDPTSGYPTGSGTSSANAHGAQVDPSCLESAGTNCAVTGWIRFVAGESGASLGGWDGWVSLGGSQPAYQVTLNASTGNFSGYAWGSSDAGWIDFSKASVVLSSLECAGVGQYAGTNYPYTQQQGPLCVTNPITGVVTCQPNVIVTTYTYPSCSPSHNPPICVTVTTDTLPPECLTTTANLTCTGYSDGQTYAYASGSPKPYECTSTTCLDNQRTTETFQTGTTPPVPCAGINPPPPPPGYTYICEDPTASNYTAPISRAGYPGNDVPDPSMCTYDVCETPKDTYGNSASNYVANPTSQDISDPESCIYIGCSDPTANNYDPSKYPNGQSVTLIDAGTPVCTYNNPGPGPNPGNPVNPVYKED